MNEATEINKLSTEAAPDTIREAQRLLKQNRQQGLNALNDIFRAGTVPDPPLDGPYKGDVVAIDIAPGLTRLIEMITAVWMPWQGKRLDPAKSEGVNIFSRGSLIMARIIWPFYREIVDEGSDTYRAFRFSTYIAPGRTDTDREVLKIDYNRPSNPGLSIRPILDELVQVADGYYLGKVHFKWWWGKWQLVAYFSLRKIS
ncbi:MAG: hypothetical protein HYR94_03800 [Chloroflexi bacterium]|nr:hypothetical protein [Chloroflexota bacterium]